MQHNPIPPLLVPEEKVFDHIKRIRAELEDWEDFPSYLRTNEWFRLEGILEEFFAMQSIDEWKDAVQALLESAIGEGSPFERLSEAQAGFIVIMMHRLLDAIWLLRVSERISPLDNEEELEPEIFTETNKT